MIAFSKQKENNIKWTKLVFDEVIACWKSVAIRVTWIQTDFECLIGEEYSIFYICVPKVHLQKLLEEYNKRVADQRNPPYDQWVSYPANTQWRPQKKLHVFYWQEILKFLKTCGWGIFCWKIDLGTPWRKKCSYQKFTDVVIAVRIAHNLCQLHCSWMAIPPQTITLGVCPLRRLIMHLER